MHRFKFRSISGAGNLRSIVWAFHTQIKLTLPIGISISDMVGTTVKSERSRSSAVSYAEFLECGHAYSSQTDDNRGTDGNRGGDPGNPDG
jgi:hypothetical protein